MNAKMKTRMKIKNKVDESEKAFVRDFLSDLAELGHEKMNVPQQLDAYHLGPKDVSILQKIANDKKTPLSVRNEARFVIGEIKKRARAKAS